MGGAVVGWARGHPRVVDGLVAALIFAYNLPIQAASVPDGFPPGSGLVIAVGLCGPYLLRRERPLTCLALVGAVFLVHVALGVSFVPADVMTFLALHTVAARCDRRVSLPAAGVVAAAWLLAAVRWDHPYFAVSETVTAVVATASVWVWGYTIGVRRAYVTALAERAAQLVRERDAQDRIAVAAERARIAREIHDVVSHGLSVVVVMAEGAATTVCTDPERAEQAMRTVERTGRSSLAEMRRMLDVLHDEGRAPGIAQVHALVADAREAGLPVELVVHGTPCELPAGADLAAFRIVQESLTNVRRHAGPDLTRVEVILRFDDGGLAVRVEDDGRGSDAAEGHGLAGMRERVAAHGGDLDAGRRAGGGFRVSARLNAVQGP